MDKTTQELKTLAEYMGEMPNLPIISILWNDETIYPSYNTSWDALVPVYAKVVTELHKTNMADMGNVNLNRLEIEIAVVVDNKQRAFEAVVELVKIINKEKE